MWKTCLPLGRVLLHIVCTEVFWMLCFNLFQPQISWFTDMFCIFKTELFSPLDKTCLFIAFIHIYKSSHVSVSHYLSKNDNFFNDKKREVIFCTSSNSELFIQSCSHSDLNHILNTSHSIYIWKKPARFNLSSSWTLV